jgi:hypothetical protein
VAFYGSDTDLGVCAGHDGSRLWAGDDANTQYAGSAICGPQTSAGRGRGAMFFFQMVGISVAPAILGLAQNSAADLESGLKAIFLVGAAAMVVSLLLITTIPEIAVDAD